MRHHLFVRHAGHDLGNFDALADSRDAYVERRRFAALARNAERRE
jgi:hypothetical protein